MIRNKKQSLMRRRPGRKILLFLLLAAFFLFKSHQPASHEGPNAGGAKPPGLNWTGQFSSAKDGDSLLLKYEGQQVHIRLYGIDAPELNQPYGPEAKKYLTELLQGQSLAVKGCQTDPYGRLVAEIFLPDGRNVSQVLVETGQAWAYPRFCQDDICRTWPKIEKEARSKKLGLWVQPSPVNPKKWRDHQKSD